MIKVFTAFSGYDSQCMALERIGVEYDLVGWSEIDKYACQAHDAVFPQFAGRNYGDISKIDWKSVPDFDLFPTRHHAKTFPKPDCNVEVTKVAVPDHHSCGIAVRQSLRNVRSIA